MTTQVETQSEIIEHQLINGLKVLTKEVHAAPVASSYIWYKVGSRNERPGLTGVSHWVEHMLFKGTPKFSKEELGRFIEGNGGRWNAFTSNDYTAYYETLPADKISVALALESDRMQNSVFDPEEVEAERTVILSEREGYENTPQFVLREEVQATAYKAHPYQWGIIGWPSDLKTMTRDDLYNYYRQRYVPNNATLVLVGDFDTAELMEQVETHFGPLPPGEPIAGPSTIEPEQRGERRVTVRKEGTLAYVAIVYHIPAAGHPDFYPLEVMSTVLSMGKTSRFYRALVDKQLATSAYFLSRSFQRCRACLDLCRSTGRRRSSHARKGIARTDRPYAKRHTHRNRTGKSNKPNGSTVYLLPRQCLKSGGADWLLRNCLRLQISRYLSRQGSICHPRTNS